MGTPVRSGFYTRGFSATLASLGPPKLWSIMSRITSLPVLMLVLLAPMVGAGDAENPEVRDPAGDSTHSTDCTPPNCLAPPFESNPMGPAMVDIIAAWIEEAGEHFVVAVQTSAPGDDLTQVDVEFTILPGANSTFASTADGQVITAQVLGTTLQAGPASTTVQREGDTLRINFTRSDTGVSGGDVLGSLQVTTTRTEHQSDSLANGSQTDSDYAPSSGQSDDFTFWRPEIVASLGITLREAMIQETLPRELAEGNESLSGPAAFNDTVERTRITTNSTIQTYDAKAWVTYVLTVQNLGTDADVFDLWTEDVGRAVGFGADQTNASAIMTLDTTRVVLDPGAEIEIIGSIEVANATGRTQAIVHVQSERGAQGNASFSVQVLPIVLENGDENKHDGGTGNPSSKETSRGMPAASPLLWLAAIGALTMRRRA